MTTPKRPHRTAALIGHAMGVVTAALLFVVLVLAMLAIIAQLAGAVFG